MALVKNNYNLFQERGDAWDAPLRPRVYTTDPEGNLRRPPEARRYELLHPPRSIPHGEHTDAERAAIVIQRFQTIDLIGRLKKERNHVLSPERGQEVPPHTIVARARAKRLRERASRHIKV